MANIRGLLVLMNGFRRIYVDANEVILVLLAWFFFWLPLGTNIKVGDFLIVDVFFWVFLLLMIVSLLLGLGRLERVGVELAAWMLVTGLILIFNLTSGAGVDSRMWWISMAVVVSVFTYRYLHERELSSAMGWVLVLILAVQAQWSAAQFIIQGDLNLRFLGESVLEIGRPGVATFSGWTGIGFIKMLRAYGPYDHPNIMGGMMAMGIIVLFNLVGWRRRWGWSMIIVMVTLLAGAAVSFSRLSGLAVLVTGLIYAGRVWQEKNGITWTVGLGKKLVVGFLMALVITPLWWWRMSDVNDVAVSERLAGYEWSIQIMGDEGFWKGAGIGNYPQVLGGYLRSNDIEHKAWQVDYVHSAPLLIMAELGIGIGLMYMLFTAGATIKYLGRMWPWMIPIIPLLLFDHYLLTQPVGQLVVLWVVLILPDSRRDHSPAPE